MDNLADLPPLSTTNEVPLSSPRRIKHVKKIVRKKVSSDKTGNPTEEIIEESFVQDHDQSFLSGSSVQNTQPITLDNSPNNRAVVSLKQVNLDQTNNSILNSSPQPRINRQPNTLETSKASSRESSQSAAPPVVTGPSFFRGRTSTTIVDSSKFSTSSSRPSSGPRTYSSLDYVAPAPLPLPSTLNLQELRRQRHLERQERGSSTEQDSSPNSAPSTSRSFGIKPKDLAPAKSVEVNGPASSYVSISPSPRPSLLQFPEASLPSFSTLTPLPSPTKEHGLTAQMILPRTPQSNTVSPQPLAHRSLSQSQSTIIHSPAKPTAMASGERVVRRETLVLSSPSSSPQSAVVLGSNHTIRPHTQLSKPQLHSPLGSSPSASTFRHPSPKTSPKPLVQASPQKNMTIASPTRISRPSTVTKAFSPTLQKSAQSSLRQQTPQRVSLSANVVNENPSSGAETTKTVETAVSPTKEMYVSPPPSMSNASHFTPHQPVDFKSLIEMSGKPPSLFSQSLFDLPMGSISQTGSNPDSNTNAMDLSTHTPTSGSMAVPSKLNTANQNEMSRVSHRMDPHVDPSLINSLSVSQRRTADLNQPQQQSPLSLQVMNSLGMDANFDVETLLSPADLLLRAIFIGDATTVGHIIDQSRSESGTIHTLPEYSMQTLFHSSTKLERKLPIAALAISRGADVNAFELAASCTSLALSITSGPQSSWKFLLQNGADLRYGSRSFNCVQHAILQRNMVFLEDSAELGLNVDLSDISISNSPNGGFKNAGYGSPLQFSIAMGQFSILPKLLAMKKQGGNENAFSVNPKPIQYGWSLLHQLAIAPPFSNQAELIQQLIDNGASLEVVDAHGQTPLLTAIQYNNHISSVALIKGGADILALDSKGQNALHILLSSMFSQTMESVVMEICERLTGQYQTKVEKAKALRQFLNTKSPNLQMNSLEWTELMIRDANLSIGSTTNASQEQMADLKAELTKWNSMKNLLIRVLKKYNV